MENSVGCSETTGMISIDTCHQQLLAHARARTVTDAETVMLAAAGGRILDADVHALLAVPPADNSAMDGYALHRDDLDAGASLQVIGRSLAGQVHDQPLAAGTCLRIMTGAPTPPECAAVVMQENIDVQADGRVRTLKGSRHGDNIRRRGEDIEAGAPLLSAGRRLRAADIGLLASQGLANVRVKRRLRVALLSTGDELAAPGTTLHAGQIYDSNRQMLQAALSALGFAVLDLGLVADQPQALERALQNADQQADAVISTGGVSVGEADYTRDVLGRLGSIELYKVAIKPGKPFAFGTLSQSVFFGLPGNPVSALVTLQKLAVPALRVMQGETLPAPLALPATLTDAIRKKPGRTDYQRGVLRQGDNGELLVSALSNQGSGVLTSISRANCFIVLPQAQGDVAAGAPVIVEPFQADV